MRTRTLWLIAAVLASGSVVSSAGPRTKPARPPKVRSSPLVFRVFDPGTLPGPASSWGRTTLRLTTVGDMATLTIDRDQPPRDQRRSQNPTRWQAVPGGASRLTGTMKVRGNGVTFWFVTPATTVALVCTNGTAEVHAPGATVAPPVCSPCYDTCSTREASPVWRPSKTHTRRGLACVLRASSDVRDDGTVRASDEPEVPGLPGLDPPPDRLFFTPEPGVELLIGPTDCPPTGLRAVR